MLKQNFSRDDLATDVKALLEGITAGAGPEAAGQFDLLLQRYLAYDPSTGSALSCTGPGRYTLLLFDRYGCHLGYVTLSAPDDESAVDTANRAMRERGLLD